MSQLTRIKKRDRRDDEKGNSITMFRQLKKNESGVVLVTIIIISMVMAILAIGMLSLNSSQVRSSEQIKRDMIAEMFARMVYWEAQANNLNGLNVVNQVQRVINTTTYTADITVGTDMPPSLNIIVSY